ncbi:MAG: O-antigen ligase family protein, partial [Granulosicoccus sp.]|nr:O-antigen ligase family protein [Granulosicoccus sp.]
LMSLFNYLGGQPFTLTYLQRDRSSGLFKNPNQYGMIASMAVPFAAAWYFQHQKKLFATFIMLAAWLALLMAASKTNMFIALLIMIMTLSYCLVSARRGAMLIIVLVTLTGFIWFLGLPVLEFFNPRAAGILQSLIQGNGSEANTINSRMELWTYSIGVMKSSPWFGEGTGQLIDVITQTHSHSHNVFLDLGRTVGIPGLVGSVMFILIAIWLSVKTLIRISSIPAQTGSLLHGRAMVIGAVFAVFSYILSNQMSDSLGPSTSVFLWLCLGLVLRRHEMVFFQTGSPESTHYMSGNKNIKTTKPASFQPGSSTAHEYHQHTGKCVSDTFVRRCGSTRARDRQRWTDE